MKNPYKAFILSLSLVSATPVFATQHLVPLQFSTIQSAINSAQNGDTVLVSPGTYFENLNYKGKNITVASTFLLTGDFSRINQTIINGSQPANTDTASVVLFVSGEGPGAVLSGFTLTGGTGTRWLDPHNGLKYREGGAILMENSSPTITHNFISKNSAVSTTGVSSAGGGAIRMDSGQPRILNNVITLNLGRYGAGIVVNYSGAIIRNNIISQNRGGQAYGGGGIWINSNFTQPIIIENNTIVGNISSTNGGGILVQQNTVTLRNNIIWGNAAQTDPQLDGINQNNATYNNIQGATPIAGLGNIAQNPQFSDAGLLSSSSAGSDAGDPNPVYNDPENLAIPGSALLPSTGTTRNDMGAYGGPGRSDFPEFAVPGIGVSNLLNLGAQPVGTTSQRKLFVINRGLKNLTIDSVKVMLHPAEITVTNPGPLLLLPFRGDTIRLSWTPQTTGALADTLLFYHNDPETPNPKKVRLSGSSILSADGDIARDNSSFIIFPNPSAGDVELLFGQKNSSAFTVLVTDMLGREVYRKQISHLISEGQSLNLSVGFLPAGCYTVQLLFTSGAVQKSPVIRFVKE